MTRFPLGLATLFCGFWLAILPNVALSQQGELPPFSQVETLIRRELATGPHYQRGDLLSRGQVEPIFESLRRIGWPVADRKSILAKLPADTDFVVQQLRNNERGTKFMRQVAKYPQGYDRLFRLAALPQGRQTVVDLIRGPGGAELIHYMTSSSGGKNLGKMLSQAPKGDDFNKPTGMIYTEDQLVERLRESYQAAQK